MRLGQLARQLEVKPSKLYSILNQDDFEDKLSLNSKLADEHVEYIKSQLSKKEDSEFVEEELPTPPLEKKVALKNKKEKPEEKPTIQDKVLLEEIKKEAEVIKAPKIKLEGPKIIDKIELVPKKSAEEVEQELKEAGIEIEDDYRRAIRNRKEQRKTKVKPISEEEKYKKYLAKRKKQEEKERRKKAQLAKKLERIEKQEKKRHYLEQVDLPPKKKVVEKKKKKVIKPPILKEKATNFKEIKKIVVEKPKPNPKTIFGKIINWFNG